MKTAAAAIAWEFRRRHRWGLVALLATIVMLGAIKIIMLARASRIDVDATTFALLVPVPLAASFFYLLAVFTFGVSGDLAARESMYPSRMFTLPVSSAALAGWPMLYGCIATALLWLAIRVVGIFPPDVHVPKYWPALFAATLVAWTQALTWMPYPFRGMRILVSIALLVSIDVVVLLALETKASESTMALLLAPLAPLAYVAGLTAVRRARRGEVLEWPVLTRLAHAFTRSAARRELATAARAQFWFEWRQYGRTLPLLVALVLPVALSLLFLFRDIPVIVVEIVTTALLLPPFLAMFVAATGKSSSNVSPSYGITPFVATRPIEDRALVMAKWQLALTSTLAAWSIVVVCVPVALTWSEATEPILGIARDVDGALGRPRAIVFGLLVIGALVVATWKQLVQGLYIAMSGRDWAVKGTAFATLMLVTVGFFVLGWIRERPERLVGAWNAIPWVMASLVALKLVLAMRVMHRGAVRGLFTKRQLVSAAIVWDLCVFALYGVLALILPAVVVRRYLLLLVAMLVVPFVRLIAAPVAVARNRHR